MKLKEINKGYFKCPNCKLYKLKDYRNLRKYNNLVYDFFCMNCEGEFNEVKG